MAKEKKRKKGFNIIFLILLNFMIIISLVVYIIYLRFVPTMIIDHDGYAVSGKEIVNNLLDTTFNVDNSIKALKVNDRDEVYQNLRTYYLGASKEKKINLDYPVYMNNSLAIHNLSKETTLITDDFNEIEGYSGYTLSSGELYNSDTLERADYNDYILMKNSDNLYINTKEMKLKTFYNNYSIPLNSIINFSNNFITYYSLKGDEFVYNKILDVNENSEFTIKDYNMKGTYKQFLIGIKILNEEKTFENLKSDTVIEDEVELEPEPQAEPEPKPEPQVEPEPEPEPQAEPEPEPEPQAEPEPEPEPQAEPELEPEPQAEPEPEPEPQVEPEPEPEPQVEPENPNQNPPEKKWIKPTVTCDNFIAETYSASSNIQIYDPSRTIHKAVTFTFYKDNQIAFRTSTTKSGTVKVKKMLPNTKYKVVGTYQFKSKDGHLIENKCLEQEIETKGIDSINPIEFSIQNGDIYSTKIELKDIHIENDILDDAIDGVHHAEIVINGVKYIIGTNILRQLLNGEHGSYQSPEGIKSNTKCEYEIVIYDTARK